MSINASDRCPTCDQPVEKKEYEVFYGTEFLNQGWSQYRVIQATSFKRAAIESARHSQHANGTRYLVIGPDDWTGPAAYKRRGRVFEINHVRAGKEDFTFHGGTLGTCHYSVTEIPVMPKGFGSYKVES